ERGRTLDVHALRTTFGTLLSKGGVAPRTAQAAMRHSDIRLTMQTYTDEKLLGVRAALDVLPALSLNVTKPDAGKVTGAANSWPAPLAPRLALTHGNSVTELSIPVTTAGKEGYVGEGT